MSKKLYVYLDVDNLTDAWHSGGGCMIITGGDPQEAMDAHQSARAAEFGEEPVKTVLPSEPTRVMRDIDNMEADAVLIFPDTGCC
jgi:hypothetical protein